MFKATSDDEQNWQLTASGETGAAAEHKRNKNKKINKKRKLVRFSIDLQKYALIRLLGEC